PAKPQIFHGRESELQHILDVLEQDSPRIAILGTGGMGKTNLAIAVLHHPVVAAKYTMLYFVTCQSTSSCAELVANIAAHIGLEKSPKPTKKIIQHFLCSPPSVLILDNLETVWEPQQSRHQVEEFLALLTDVHNLALIITMRGTERPDRVKWTKPFLAPLKPLSHLAAMQTFIDIADDDHAESSIFKLLDLTGNLPLAVNLIAHVAAYEGCNRTLARWTTERTHVLSDGYDEKSSLDISIMLSFTGARMTPEAQHLLEILSMLPDGLSDTELVESSLPINNVITCKATLIRTALAYTTPDSRLKVLVPIREHILANHPPSAELKVAIYNYYHRLLGL
ncbi:P-loop containing nucleoside triphosphate hydrolase protein, partial [Mycena albidolilacea]